jgi:hypothetical protein
MAAALAFGGQPDAAIEAVDRSIRMTPRVRSTTHTYTSPLRILRLDRAVSAAGCDASRAWSGAVLRPLSLLDIYSIFGESVLRRRQTGAALRIPAPVSSQTAKLGERC